tara:strand:- start:510 stop:1544 length:1035 start_codon:yes stop_codon:yes gene_type:complete
MIPAVTYLSPSNKSPVFLRQLGIALSASIAAVALSLSTQANAQERVFRSADVQPEGFPTVEAVEYMGELLEERSDGRLSVDVFASGQLGNEKETIEQARFGIIDMNRISLGGFNNLIPETVVLSLPYVFRSVEHMRNTVDGPIGDEILSAFEPHGLVGLAFLDAGTRNFYNSVRPIESLEDMEGLKIRVQPSDIFIDMVNEMGANAVAMGFGELYSGLQTGVIDGTEQSWPTYEAANHVDVAEYYSITEHLILPEALVMSKTVFDGLSPEDQQLVRQAAKDIVPYMRELWDEREKSAEETVRSQGAQVFTVDKQPFIDAMVPVQKKYLDSPELKDLFERIQAVE